MKNEPAWGSDEMSFSKMQECVGGNSYRCSKAQKVKRN